MANILKREPENEMEYWEMIYDLGGFIWHTNHDIGHRRYDSSPELMQSLADARQTADRLVSELLEKFGVIHPKDCPQKEIGQESPPAPEGKIYYWDWYDKMKTERQRRFLDSIICSACPFSEGVKGMINFEVPCGVFRGSIYRLSRPHHCEMLHDWSEDELHKRILEQHGPDALEAFKKKKAELMAAGQTKG